MSEILGDITGFALIIFCIIYYFRKLVKEQKETREFQQNLLNTLSQISLSIEDTFKEN